MAQLQFTVAICTLNRAALLPTAIESVLRQEFPLEEIELLVVDNGSTDGTAEVTRGFADRSRGIVRHVIQPKPGLSRSRNHVIEIAQAPFVLYLDDDATAMPGWLSSYARLFRGVSTFEGAGGKIKLHWEKGRPTWLREREEGWWAALDLGPVERSMVFPESPFGANMGWRKDTLERLGGFDEGLGYGTETRALVPCEDMHLAYRIYNEGGALAYLPDAAVIHWIGGDRSTPTYACRRAYYQGIADARLIRVREKGVKTNGALRRWLHRIALWRARSAGRMLPGGAFERYRVLLDLKANYNQGFLEEWKSQ